jgi:prepilin peptidase CpaA
MLFLQSGAIAVGLAGCVWDIRTRRIPNALTFGGALLGLCASAFEGGLAGAGVSLVGWALGAAVFLPFFLVRGMGGGDVKLMAALGAWLGPGPVMWSALYAGIAGGLLAVALSLYHGYLKQALTNLGGALLYWRTAGPGPVPGLTLATARGPRLPYALPILVGTVVAIWLR